MLKDEAVLEPAEALRTKMARDLFLGEIRALLAAETRSTAGADKMAWCPTVGRASEFGRCLVRTDRLTEPGRCYAMPLGGEAWTKDRQRP